MIGRAFHCRSSHATHRLEDCYLVFTTQDLWAGPTQCSATFYLHVDDVARYYERVKDRAQIAWPMQDMTYGSREFGVRDCDGYYLAFAQVNCTGG